MVTRRCLEAREKQGQRGQVDESLVDDVVAAAHRKVSHACVAQAVAASVNAHAAAAPYRKTDRGIIRVLLCRIAAVLMRAP
jgi:hypothetical protein